MNRGIIFYFISVLIPGMLLLVSCRKPATVPQVIGIKAYNHSGGLPALFKTWHETGINTLFVSPELASKEGFMDLAGRYAMPVFLIVPTFFNPDALKEDPSLYAIKADGEHAVDEWVQFICPNRADYRRRHLEYLTELVKSLSPAGVSLDFIRYFVYWEMILPETRPEELPQTCFDRVCLEKFTREYSLTLPAELVTVPSRAKFILENHLNEWTEFKCRTIADYVQEITTTLKKTKPDLRFCLHLVPWKEDDYGGAIREIAAQDINMLSPYVDFISPMCYSHMLQREPNWVHDVVNFISISNEEKILPSIQVSKSYRDERFSAGEFGSALQAALAFPSRGVVFWSWEALEKEPDKLAGVREYLRTASE